VKPAFFDSSAAFRRWLEEHHDSTRELLLGFYKRGARKSGITYREALDEALCFGWIDGVRKAIDDEKWTIRFTPRKPRSIWSVVNTKRAHELIAGGAMRPPGLAAFEQRDEQRTQLYSYEAQSRPLDESYARRLRANEKAFRFFEAQPPSYQRIASWYVMSAKQEGTRQRRLASLIASSARGERIGQVTYKPKERPAAKRGRK